jgi:hypothetical protein
LKKIIVILLLLQMAGCEFYSEENQKLRNDLRQTEIEISGIMGSPEFMFAEAFSLVNERNYKDAVTKLENVKQYFPEWNTELLTEFIGRFKKLTE